MRRMRLETNKKCEADVTGNQQKAPQYALKILKENMLKGVKE